MANGDMLSNAEVEAAFLAVGLKWMPGPREGVWVLPFHNADTGTGELVLVDNGIGNEGFVGVQIGLGTVTNNPDCIRKVLCLANGFLALAKLSVDGKGEITVRVVGPRQRGMFQQEMLKHLVGSAMAAAGFVRPLLTACAEDDRCDAAAVFTRRVTEVSGRGPVIGPPRPPGVR